jgi:hypothetical protein
LHAPPVSPAVWRLTDRWCAARDRILKRLPWRVPEVAEIVGDRLIPLDQVEPLATKQCSRPSCRGRLLAKTVGRLCDTHAALPHCWPYYRYGLAHTPPETKPVWSRPTAEPIDGPPWLTDEDAIVGYIDARLKRADAPSEPSAEPQQFNKTLADAQALGLVTSKQREALELVSTMNHTEGAANLGISREGFTDRLRGAVKSVGKKFPERKNDVKEALERPHIRPAEGRAPTDPLLGFDLEKTIAEFSRLGPDAYRAVMEKCDDEIARAARVHDVKVVEKARRMGATSVIRLDEDNPQSRVQVVEYNTEGDQVGGGDHRRRVHSVV